MIRGSGCPGPIRGRGGEREHGRKRGMSWSPVASAINLYTMAVVVLATKDEQMSRLHLGQEQQTYSTQMHTHDILFKVVVCRDG